MALSQEPSLISPFPPPRPWSRGQQCCWKCEVTSGLITPAFGSRIIIIVIIFFCRESY